MKECIENNINKLRLEAKVTQEELADAVGVTRQTIIAIEKGKYVPSLLLAFRLARQFKKHIEEIFFYEH